MLKLPEKYKNKEILYRRLILFTFGLGLVVLYIPQIIGFIGDFIWICLPFLIGSVIAFVLLTFCRVLMRFAKYALKIQEPEKYLVAFKIATLVILLGFLALLVAFIIPQLFASIENLAKEVPAHITRLLDKLYQAAEDEPLLLSLLDKNEDLFRDVPALINRIVSFLFAGFAGPGLVSLQSLISSTFSWIWITFLSLAFSFIAFFNAPRFSAEASLVARAYLPKKAYEKAARFLSLVSAVFTQYIGGTVLECIILATIVTIGGLILNIPYAILAGVFCGICALVPMFGATAGAFVCALLMSFASPGKALTFLVMFLLIQQVEGNFIYPNVVGKTTGLPPLFVIVAITIGASTAGILGMIISIPIASILYGLILQQALRKTEEKDLDIDAAAIQLPKAVAKAQNSSRQTGSASSPETEDADPSDHPEDPYKSSSASIPSETLLSGTEGQSKEKQKSDSSSPLEEQPQGQQQDDQDEAHS